MADSCVFLLLVGFRCLHICIEATIHAQHTHFNSTIDKILTFDDGNFQNPLKLRSKGTYAPQLMLLSLHGVEYNVEAQKFCMCHKQRRITSACCLLNLCAHLQMLSHSTPLKQPLRLSYAVPRRLMGHQSVLMLTLHVNLGWCLTRGNDRAGLSEVLDSLFHATSWFNLDARI